VEPKIPIKGYFKVILFQIYKGILFRSIYSIKAFAKLESQFKTFLGYIKG